MHHHIPCCDRIRGIYFFILWNSSTASLWMQTYKLLLRLHNFEKRFLPFWKHVANHKQQPLLFAVKISTFCFESTTLSFRTVSEVPKALWGSEGKKKGVKSKKKAELLSNEPQERLWTCLGVQKMEVRILYGRNSIWQCIDI